MSKIERFEDILAWQKARVLTQRGAWTECARPRAQQRAKEARHRFIECFQNLHIAAPEDGRTPEGRHKFHRAS